MTHYPLLAGAAWLRLAVVGADVLAVVAVIRLCKALGAWWRAPQVPWPASVAVRVARHAAGRH